MSLLQNHHLLKHNKRILLTPSYLNEYKYLLLDYSYLIFLSCHSIIINSRNQELFSGLVVKSTNKVSAIKCMKQMRPLTDVMDTMVYAL